MSRIWIGASVFPGTTGLHIQACPPAEFALLGSVPALKPTAAMAPLVRALVQARKGGGPVDPQIPWNYRRAYDAEMRHRDVRPGTLRDANGAILGDGITLCCACSPAEAAAGYCHRVWAAWWLDRAGWEVWMDWSGISPGGAS